jgi:superfamily II helicase
MVAERHGNAIGNKVKCMKLPFLVEYPMFEKNIKGFNCVYFKHDHGPMSKNIYPIWQDLKESGYIQIKGNYIELTEEGRELAQAFIKEVLKSVDNKFFLDAMEKVADDFGGLSSITPFIYDMVVYGIQLDKHMKVRDLPKSITITRVVEDKDALKVIKIPNDWLQTLAITLNPINKKSVEKGLEDLRHNRVTPHDRAWASV